MRPAANAGESLQNALVAALETVPGIGAVYRETPRRSAFPYAVAEVGAESDWGHKTGAGREVRIAVVLRDGGERADRLRELGNQAEAAVAEIGPDLGEWRIVSFSFLRRRTAPSGSAWAAAIEYRVRMLAS